MGEKVKKYALLYIAFIIYSGTTVCAKLAAQQKTLLWFGFFLGAELLALGVYAILWQQVLKKFPLVVAMSCKGIVVILNLIWAVILFKEHISLYNILGGAIIIFGIWMVSSDV